MFFLRICFYSHESHVPPPNHIKVRARCPVVYQSGVTGGHLCSEKLPASSCSLQQYQWHQHGFLCWLLGTRTSAAALTIVSFAQRLTDNMGWSQCIGLFSEMFSVHFSPHPQSILCNSPLAWNVLWNWDCNSNQGIIFDFFFYKVDYDFFFFIWNKTCQHRHVLIFFEECWSSLNTVDCALAHI